MFSNKSSRASSLLSLLSNENAPKEEVNTKKEEDLEDDYDENPNFTRNRHYKFTESHPIGSILLKLARDSTNLARKSNVDSMFSNIDDLCAAFHRGIKQERAENRSNIEQTSAEIENNIIFKELNSHKINTAIEPPTNFSQVPTLTSPQKLAEVIRIFPKTGKFSGYVRDGHMPVTEFLTTLKEAQEKCNLSEDEFISRMLAASTGLAHELIMEWRTNGENADAIFHNLLINFDKRLSADDAKVRLNAYKVNRNSDLAQAERQIMQLATRAATSLPVGDSRTSYYNMEACNALIRALPPTSSNNVSNFYHMLTARLGRACTFLELTKGLNALRVSIDRDIKQSGQEGFRQKRNNGSQPKNRPRFSTYNISAETKNSGVIQSVNNNTPVNTNNNFRPKEKTSTSFTPRPINRNFNRQQGKGQFNKGNKTFKTSYNSRNKAVFKPKCSLCGIPNHKPQDCTNMVDNNGKRLNMMPMLGVCSKCPRYIYPRLHHQEWICPYRVGGPLFKKN